MQATLHASAVAWGKRAALIRGPSSSGKSSLALHLMAFGAQLIGDDLITVRDVQGQLEVSRAVASVSAIEARNVGILCATTTPSAIAVVMIDLSRSETERLPRRHQTPILGVMIDVVFGADTPNLAPAIMQYLRAGRHN